MARPRLVGTGVALLVVWVSGSGRAGQLSNLQRPADYMPRDAASAVSLTGDFPVFVVFKDVDPWGQPLNERALQWLEHPYQVVTSARFGGYSLAGKKVIVVASDQPTSFYQALHAERGKLKAFVQEGGVLLAHAFCKGWEQGDWAGLPWIPRMDTWAIAAAEYVQPAYPLHPIVTGYQSGDLENWYCSTIGYFPETPSGSTWIAWMQRPEGTKCCYVEYRAGLGRVVATLMAIDWYGGEHKAFRRGMLRRELAYGLSQANIAELQWADVEGYRGDGVHPNRGQPDATRFVFKVKVRHPRGLEPRSVRLALAKDGLPYKLKAPEMHPGPQPVTTGRIYTLGKHLPAGNFAYRFSAAFADGVVAKGQPSLLHAGPAMPSAPYLVWSSEPGFKGVAGVKPDKGTYRKRFEFRGVYRDHDGDAPLRSVRLKLWRNGAFYGAYPMYRPTSGLDWVAGVPYWFGLELRPGGYEYQFVAADRDGPAVGPASLRMSGPTVTSKGPTLSWAGEAGFMRDGVAPDQGRADDLYRFKVKLSDPHRAEPAYVRVLLRNNGMWWKALDMGSTDPTDLTQGRIYSCQVQLPAGNWEYSFTANTPRHTYNKEVCPGGLATGPPTMWQVGPTMPAPPYLVWATGPGYDGLDGVEPDKGTANSTRFRFRVIYRSHDGDAAGKTQVILWRNTKWYRAVRMAPVGSTDDPVNAGIAHAIGCQLPAGNYYYRFVARDARGVRAVGPAANRTAGPVVRAEAASAAVTSLAATPTGRGAQITFTLSSAAQIEARILNIAGRPIKSLCHAKDCEAGTNTLLWNAHSDTGLAVPNGTYLVRVSAKAADGSHSRAVARVTIPR